MEKLNIWIRLCCIGFMTGILLLCATDAVAAAQQPDFPQEPLMKRLQAIERLKQVSISFEGEMVKNLTVQPLAVEGKNADELIAQSLRSTALSYVKVNDNRYAIVRRKADAPASAAPQQQTAPRGKGRLSGTVVDKDGFPVPGATVIIAGTTTGTATDVRGQFSLDLPARTVAVEISCISYQKMKVSDVRIAAGKTTPLDIVLQDATEELAEVVVTATYNKASAQGLYAKQKARTVMSDGISADLIKKTSDNNVAQVLKRVSGVTVENGKYVTIRGMGERYNNVQLNGATLPSTEPNRRNFSFDVIPTGLIDNVTIAKTFTPDLPGEFTGGLVEVQTLAVPEKKFMNVSIGTGMNTISTGKDFLSNQRFKSDWFLGEIDDRKWYAGQDEAATKQSMANAGNKNTYGLKKFKAMPLQNYSLTVGMPFHFGNDQKIGVVAALTYRNEQTHEEIKEAHFITHDSIFKPGNTYRLATSVGAVANVGWEMPGHKITWRNLFNNRFTHTNRERYINKDYEHYEFVEQYSAPLISRVMQTQLEGEHNLFNDRLIFTWNGSYNKSGRTVPDDRYATGYVKGESEDGSVFTDWNLSTQYGGTDLGESHIMYSNLDENKKNIAANLAFPFVVMGNKQQLKTGYAGTFRHAEYEQIYLKPFGIIRTNDPRYGAPIDEFFAPERFNDGTFVYKSGMELPEADFYKGEQTIHAAYLMGEFTFFRKLHLSAGVRMEKGKTETNSKFMVGGNVNDYIDTLCSVKHTDWLPAATLVFNITDNINVRAAYSQTIARPDFRELTTVTYYNADDRVVIRNWKPVEQSSTNNYDLRLEWYPQAGEVVSVSAFYKKFKSPVEMITYAPSPVDIKQHPFNLDDASIKGIELNIRKSLGFIAPATFLQDMYVSANATFIKGNVSYNLDELLSGSDSKIERESRERPLQGLSPYTINAGLTYQGKILGAALNYGRNGRKLVMAGEHAEFDQYEASRNVLDLQLSARFLKERLEVKFNASDLLNEDVIIYRNCKYVENEGYTDLTSDMNYNAGDWVMSRIKKGVNLSLSVGYKF